MINDAAELSCSTWQIPSGTVKAVAESAMREVVGRIQHPADPHRRTARASQTEVQDLMQRTLDAYGAGVPSRRCSCIKVDPPAEVIDAYRDVQAARADQDRSQNEAQTYANKVVPEARGQASQITKAARPTRADHRRGAGRGRALLQVYEIQERARRDAPADVSRDMEEIFGDMNKVIVDERGTAQGVVPYLPLDR